MSSRETLVDPLVSKNPVTLQVLGICSALAITNTLLTALIMSLSLTAVLAFSNVSISLIRNHLPNSVRIIVQVTIIATGVIVVDETLFPDRFDHLAQGVVYHPVTEGCSGDQSALGFVDIEAAVRARGVAAGF